MDSSALLLLLSALLGHGALWVTAVNRLHGTAVQRPWRGLLTLFGYAWLCAGPFVAAGLIWIWGAPSFDWRRLSLTGFVANAYLILCAAFAILTLAVWAIRKLQPTVPAVLVEVREATHDYKKDFIGASATWFQKTLLGLPLNECFQIAVNEKQLYVPGLPEELEGLSIAHASDFHLTGALPKEFYLRAVEHLNAFGADLIALTGDFVDRRPFGHWLPEILSGLSAPQGVYAVLGNHDVKLDKHYVRSLLRDADLVDLGLCPSVKTISGHSVVLAGSEWPWVRSRAANAELRPVERAPFRILLSHSPDQIFWAAENQFDLVLAGHTHGGQVIFPILGPIVAPSVYGVRYAAGVFQRGRTVMHVSRGLAGETPLRFRCTPELSLLKLTAKRPAGYRESK